MTQITQIKKLYNFIGDNGRTKTQIVNLLLADNDVSWSHTTVRNYVDVLIAMGVLVKSEGLFFRGIK